MEVFSVENPWVSFCMSTYKRPELLTKQLLTISQQTFKDFEVVISDNDPANSAEEVVKQLNDPRFKYFSNGKNLGMMQSFNQSIERAKADHIVMITDDDPVENNFLQDLFHIYKENSNYGLFAGFIRQNKKQDNIEIIEKDKFAEEILDPSKTRKILWSSCIIKKQIAIKIGKIPVYGSPHLADHAFIAMSGSIAGGVIINKMYSSLSSHDNNFSKTNFETYKLGCIGFFDLLTDFYRSHPRSKYIKAAVAKHLKNWFLVNVFALKKYYTFKKDAKHLFEVNEYAKDILKLKFMMRYKRNLIMKNFIFSIKRILNFYH